MKTLKQFIMEGDADFSSAERLAKGLTRKFNDSIGPAVNPPLYNIM